MDDSVRSNRSAMLAVMALGAALSFAVLAFVGADSGGARAALAAAGLIPLIDIADMVLRIFQARSMDAFGPGGIRGELDKAAPAPRPYAIVVSVFDAVEEIPEFVEAMAPHRENVWVIDDASNDDTRRLLHRYGYRCLPLAKNRKKPGAIRELVNALPASIETIVIIDPDMRFSSTEALERSIAGLQASGAASACPRVRIARRSVLSMFQRFEYDMSIFLGRQALGELSVNSGVSIYRRDALSTALDLHSLSVYAEDLETSVILLSMGEDVYFDRHLEVMTTGAQSLRGLFSQRVGWAYGHIKVYAERMPELLTISRRRLMAAYQFLVYLGLLSIVMQPLRAFAYVLAFVSLLNGLDLLAGTSFVPDGALSRPEIFALIYAQYTVLALLGLNVSVERRERLQQVPVALCYVFYAMFLCTPVTVGFLNWLTLRFGGRRLYDDHYQDASDLLAQAAMRPSFRPGVEHA